MGIPPILTGPGDGCRSGSEAEAAFAVVSSSWVNLLGMKETSPTGDGASVAAPWTRLRDFVREATLTFRQGGFKGTLRRYGWRLFAGFFLFYLVRDVTLYIVVPYLVARGFLSLSSRLLP